MSTYAGTQSHAPHLGDDELLRLIDDDDDARRVEWEAHVAACGRCAGELEALRRDAYTLSAWLDRAAFEEGETRGLLHSAETDDAGDDTADDVVRLDDVRVTRRARTGSQQWIAPWLRVAAVLALMATPLAAIPALREWVVGTFTGRDAAPPATTLSAPPELTAATGAAAIRFVPAAGSFIVEVDVRQAAGELRVSRVAGTEAVLEAAVGDAGVPVVSAALLRIRNTPGMQAGWSLQVPASVSSVTVRIGGRSVVLERDRIDAGAGVPLH